MKRGKFGWQASICVLCLTVGFGVGSQIVNSGDVTTPTQVRSPRSSSSLGRFRSFFHRNASASQVGRNHDAVKSGFRDVVAGANQSTVQIISKGKQVAFGIVVDPDGYVLTKASELPKSPKCRLPHHGTVAVNVIATDKSLDLALLKVEASKLSPAQFAATTVQLGDLLAVPCGFNDQPTVIGVVSGQMRRIPRDHGLLGVMLSQDPGAHPVIDEVFPGSCAHRHDLHVGDEVATANGKTVTSIYQLQTIIRRFRPGEQVKLEIVRDDRSLQREVVLGRLSQVGIAEPGMEERVGGPLSERRSGFAEVIQHDCIIGPHQCGGPLVDLDGRVVGLNIARASRVETYALPARLVVDRWNRWKSDLASR